MTLNVNVQTSRGETPIMCACEQKRLNCLKILLQRDDIVLSLKDNNGYTVYDYLENHDETSEVSQEMFQCLQEYERNHPMNDDAHPKKRRKLNKKQ